MIDIFDLFDNRFNSFNPENIHEDMVALKTYIETLEGSSNGTIHVQDIFYYLIDKNHLSEWDDVRALEAEIADDIRIAFDYFIDQEWYEEAKRLKKAMQYMEDYLIRNSEKKTR